MAAPGVREIAVEVKMSAAQAEFLNSTAIYRALAGGLGSGKSWCGAYSCIRKLLKNKPGRLYMAVAPDYRMLNDATFRSFCDLACALHLLEPKKIKKSAPPQVTLVNGTEVLFRSADDPERLRGPNLSHIWLDEASLMHKDVFQITIGRLREGGEQGSLDATFTPKGKQHWTYDVFATGKPNTFLRKVRTCDNPFLPPLFYQTLKGQYGSRLAMQELEGEFLDPAESMFRREWFRRRVREAPNDMVRLRAWDKAATSKDAERGEDADYSAGVQWGRSRSTGTFYLLHALRGKWSSNDRNSVMRMTAEQDGPEVEILIEQEPGASGKESAEWSVRQLAGFNVHAQTSTGKKEIRAQPLAAQLEAGNVVLVEADWNEALVDEFVSFPGGIHDDLVDAASNGFNRLALGNHAWDFVGSDPRDSIWSRMPAGLVMPGPDGGDWEHAHF